ncbi:MAG: hypothetical protein D6683_18300 [Actinomyces sp.]|nr:MAG: hypothetical protein D6683_18300 [Actinomyces sp.]
MVRAVIMTLVLAAACSGGATTAPTADAPTTSEPPSPAPSTTGPIAATLPSTTATTGEAAPAAPPAPTTTLVTPPTTVAGTTPVFLTVFSHNERTASRYDAYATDPAGYAVWRAALLDVARLLHERGVRYSWQTDYLMVDAIERFEADALAADPGPTDAKPLITYLVEDLGVSVEPHAHECIDPPRVGDCTREPYDYADVVARITEVTGVVPAPVIGGTSEAERSLEEFAACIPGNVTDKPWCPTILTGFAGTRGGHATDDHHSGVWRPSGFGAEDFLVDDPSGRIANVGRGYSLGAFSSFGGAEVDPLTFITDLADRLADGRAPAGRMYTATLNFNEDALIERDLLDDIAAVLDALQPLVDEGRVIYANFPEVIAAWEHHYGAEPNIFAYEP